MCNASFNEDGDSYTLASKSRFSLSMQQLIACIGDSEILRMRKGDCDD